MNTIIKKHLENSGIIIARENEEYVNKIAQIMIEKCAMLCYDDAVEGEYFYKLIMQNFGLRDPEMNK